MPPTLRRLERLSPLILLVVFFAVFHARVPRAHFGLDEMANLYGYWHRPLWKTALAIPAIWTKVLRPTGAVYYLPLYRLFGLNPHPFGMVRVAFLFANTLLFWRLTAQIVRSEWVAILAAFPVAYHADLGNLAYDGAFIYDVLCGGFYFAALLYYVHARRHRARLEIPQFCVFLALYLAALGSKEMAVSLPVLILAYELLFARPKPSWGPCLASAAITALFIAAKTTGADALTAMGGYQPEFSWPRFSESSVRFLNTIFYTNSFSIPAVLALWGLLLILGIWKLTRPLPDPRWLFLWTWIIVTPLPLAFLPGRGAATLYIVAAGWAMLAAMSARVLVRWLSRRLFGDVPLRWGMTAGLLAAVALYAHETQRRDRRLIADYLREGHETQQAIDQFKALRIHPARGSRIVFLNDPFPASYHTVFIAALFWDDPSLEIHLQSHDYLPDPQLARMNYVFDWSEGGFVLVRSSPDRLT
jgi:hypothetical protein